MKPYVNYRKTYPKLDRFLHLVARFVFAGIAFVGVTAFIFTVTLQDGASSSGLMTEIGEDGTLVWNMEFFGIIALVGIIFAFGAFLVPDSFRSLGNNNTYSKISPTLRHKKLDNDTDD